MFFSTKELRLSSRAWYLRQRRDPFRRDALKPSTVYTSRSALKLSEINDRFHLLTFPSHSLVRIADLGCHPGGWHQYLQERLTSPNFLLGIDLGPPQDSLQAEGIYVQGDILELSTLAPRVEAHGCLPGSLHRVFSDLSPSQRSGHKVEDFSRQAELSLAALRFACRYLSPGGHALLKVLGGTPWSERVYKEAETFFSRLQWFRPRATRQGSTEQYLVAFGFKDLFSPRRETFTLESWPGFHRSNLVSLKKKKRRDL